MLEVTWMHHMDLMSNSALTWNLQWTPSQSKSVQAGFHTVLNQNSRKFVNQFLQFRFFYLKNLNLYQCSEIVGKRQNFVVRSHAVILDHTRLSNQRAVYETVSSKTPCLVSLSCWMPLRSWLCYLITSTPNNWAKIT